mmetsp:Transcript_13377/g.23693  ORF Transcript_13377/g.23693 Transcript_13377/m.23693 type:complete len:213 (-) Transcript_13377:3474-4112(-)
MESHNSNNKFKREESENTDLPRRPPKGDSVNKASAAADAASADVVEKTQQGSFANAAARDASSILKNLLSMALRRLVSAITSAARVRALRRSLRTEPLKTAPLSSAPAPFLPPFSKNILFLKSALRSAGSKSDDDVTSNSIAILRISRSTNGSTAATKRWCSPRARSNRLRRVSNSSKDISRDTTASREFSERTFFPFILFEDETPTLEELL